MNIFLSDSSISASYSKKVLRNYDEIIYIFGSDLEWRMQLMFIKGYNPCC